MTRRALLTGGSGFLASRVAPLLREQGLDVVTVDRRAGSDLAGDLADPGFVATLPDVDVVVHAAATQYVSGDLPLVGRRRYFARNNVAATAALVERYRGAVDQFVNVGTSMMLQPGTDGLHGAGGTMRGEGAYSRSKLAADRVVDGIDAPHATVIPCIIGGVGREGLFRGFVESMTRRRLAICPGSGRRRTHMVHVDDVAALVALVVERRAVGGFPAAGPEPLTVRRWIDVIADELDLDGVRTLTLPYPAVVLGAVATQYRVIAREQLVMLGRDHVLDTAPSTHLGWRPRWSNEDIVRDIARYIATTRGALRSDWTASGTGA